MQQLSSARNTEYSQTFHFVPTTFHGIYEYQQSHIILDISWNSAAYS